MKQRSTRDISTILTIRVACRIKKKKKKEEKNSEIEKCEFQKKEKKDLIARKTYYSTSVQLVQLLSTHLDNPRRDLPFSPQPHPRNMWRLLIFSLPL